MYIHTDIFAKILGIRCPYPELYFKENGFDIIAINEITPGNRKNTFVRTSDAIRFVHKDNRRLQIVMAYKAKDAWEKDIQNTLLCRCEL